MGLNIPPPRIFMQTQTHEEEEALLLRVFNRNSVCLMLKNGPGAVIQAELNAPISPRSFVAAQSINAMNSVPAKVVLGPFDTDTCRFLNCYLDAYIPQPAWNRVNYLARKKSI